MGMTLFCLLNKYLNHECSHLSGSNLRKIECNHKLVLLVFRYNITAGEYDGWDSAVNSALNGRRIFYNMKYNLPITDKKAKARGYYYRNDPDVSIFKDVPGFKLRIQINTNQDAITFQDR
jgi:hypothetical protein